MTRYTQESIERLRGSIDIVELVSERTDLRRRGSRWVGLCPFHDERTPSFTVDPSAGLYHCFGCQAGGDAITFVRETQSLDFADVVEQLAERFTVELKREREDPQEEERRRRRERLLKLLDRTAGFYAKYMWESAEAAKARDYLAGRGLLEETLRTYRVGYAPSAWDRLLTSARREGFTEAELRAADLVSRGRSGGLYDRFRERITFPLADKRGRVLGFGARAMRDGQGPKYLNTGESDVYRKGKLLFGLDHARPAIAKAQRVVVVEGYTDVLALHQAGVREAVAIMGTALTDDQLRELARTAGKRGTIFLALDADGAGQDAMLRASRMAGEREIDLRVAQLPADTDPADLVAAGGTDAVTGILSAAVSVLEFEIGRVIANADLDTPEGRDWALEGARELIAAAPERSARRDHLVRLVADRLDVSSDYVAVHRSASARRQPAAEPAPQAASAAHSGAIHGTLEAERTFLALCLRAGSLGREHLEQLEPDHFSSGLTSRVRDYLLEHFDDPLDALSGRDDEFVSMVASVAMRTDDEPATQEDVLKISFLALELRRIERDVRRANKAGDRDRQRELASAKQRLRREMDAAMGQVQ